MIGCGSEKKAELSLFAGAPLRDYVCGLTACIFPEHLVSIDNCQCDNVSPSGSWVKPLVFLTLLALVRMVVRVRWKSYETKTIFH